MADRPRFLARQAGKRHPKQYTDSRVEALPNEPEAIPEDVQREISSEARNKWQVMRAQEIAQKQTRSRLGKLEQLENEARKRNVDVSRHTIAIDRELNAMQHLVWPA